MVSEKLPKKLRKNLVDMLRQLADDIDSEESEVVELLVEYPYKGAKISVQVKYPD